MHVDVKIQNNDNETLYQIIKSNLLANPKNCYFYSGIFKESGLQIIESCLEKANSNIFFVIGIDKKNTNKNMLETLLNYSNNVYVYDNNSLKEYDASIVVFEYLKKATVISSTANLSEGGIKNNLSIYTVIDYDLNNKTDKVEFDKVLKNFLSILQNPGFIKLTSQYIDDLLNSKVIFTTKQYLHSNVKSISELINQKTAEKVKKINKNDKKSVVQQNNNSNEVYSDFVIDMPKIDLDDSSIKIEIPEEEIENEKSIEINAKKQNNKNKEKEKEKDNESQNISESTGISDTDDRKNLREDLTSEQTENDIKYNENDTLDIENLLFTKADVKLDIASSKNSAKEVKNNINDKEKENVLEDSVKLKPKKIDLTNISDLFIQLEQKSTKEQDLNSIKIPNYINDTIPNFFKLIEKGKLLEENGSMMREKDINVEIVDVKNNVKYNDKSARIMHRKGQSYIFIYSGKLKNIEYDEFDIARIIKLDDNNYHIEIVSKNIEEYKIWEKLCINKMKSNQRKYGFM